jgi:thioredoxin 1
MTMAGNNVFEAQDATFEQDVLRSEVPVLVDFWAPWCQPCLRIAPAIDELAGKYAGQAKVAKLNIDEHPETPDKYGVRSIPTLLVFKDGQVVNQIVGALPKDRIEALLKQALG